MSPRRSRDRSGRITLLRALRSDCRGQDLVEFVLTLPILLVLAFGVLEFGALLDVTQSVTGLTREGANIASRGASLDSVVLVTTANGSNWDLAATGTVVATRMTVQGGVAMILDQRTAGGLGATSRVGIAGNPATAYQAQGLVDGQIYHVVEVFLPYQPFTPLQGFVGSVIPDTLYDRTLF
ncbi:MAG: TadE/TadG family type IV pilus assembly protein [Gemmatimonadota bacterium]